MTVYATAAERKAAAFLDDDEASTPGELGEVEPLRLRAASTIRAAKPEWVWVDRLPIGGVALVAGREGQGKTALVLDIAARVTRGTLPGDRHGRPGTVVYLGAEDDAASVLVPRLIAADADLARVHLVDMPAGVTLAEDADRLDAALAGLDEVALVIVDPLDSHLGARLDSHRKAEVQAAIGLLAAVAQDHRCAAVGVAHLSKGDSRDLLTRVVGSVGFTTAARVVLGVGEHPEDQADRLAVVAKSNLGDRRQVPAVRFRVDGTVVHVDGLDVPTGQVVLLGEETGHDADVILNVPTGEERTERGHVAEWLTELLADEPVAYRDVERAAREEGISRATLHRAKALAGVIVDRDTTARGRPSTWRLSASSHRRSVSDPRAGCETEPYGDETAGQDGYADTPEGVSSRPPARGTEPAGLTLLNGSGDPRRSTR